MREIEFNNRLCNLEIESQNRLEQQNELLNKINRIKKIKRNTKIINILFLLSVPIGIVLGYLMVLFFK